MHDYIHHVDVDCHQAYPQVLHMGAEEGGLLASALRLSDSFTSYLHQNVSDALHAMGVPHTCEAQLEGGALAADVLLDKEAV